MTCEVACGASGRRCSVAFVAPASWKPADGTTFAATLRHVGLQYEDDQETDALPAATTVDLFAQVPLVDKLSFVGRVENLFDEEIVTRLTPDHELVEALAETREPLVLAGHTHMQLDRRVDRWRFVNVGSVGRPYEERPGAYWALLGPDVELVRTDYDVEAAAEAVLASGQPRAAEVGEMLVRPPSPDEASAEFERLRSS